MGPSISLAEFVGSARVPAGMAASRSLPLPLPSVDTGLPADISAGLLLARHKFLEELAPTKTQGLVRVALVFVYSPFGLQKM